MLISIETHITCDFPGGGVRTPYPPSGSAHIHISLIFWVQTVRGLLDFQFLAQDLQIEEGGSQDFLIQNVSGSTVEGLWARASPEALHCVLEQDTLSSPNMTEKFGDCMGGKKIKSKIQI